MYEEIMRSSRDSFFALLNAGFAGESMFRDGGITTVGNILNNEMDNEWMQEYYIIYNSYILDRREPDGLNN
ncbi:MAG TPA: hypothetical protein VKD08_13680 [Ignavibacteriaceae bacterium]|nr:hypothetical protein [Ignavibacteriaceae bacterium]